jgi:hypothetical protein
MKTFNLYLFATPALLLLILSSHIAGQTNISDTVGGVWTLAGSPYRIVGDTYVPADSALYIEPGVSVQFTGEFVLAVSGNIQAIGAEQDSIEFRPVDTGMYTKGLCILNGQDTCRFEHCIFKDFKKQAGSCQGGAIKASSTSMVIDRSSFRNNIIELNSTAGASEGYGGAVYLSSCSGYIQNSSFIDNGIMTAEDANAYEGCGGAIYNQGNIIIRNNLITHNSVRISYSYEGVWDGGCEAKGGGIYTDYVVVNSIISSNRATASSYVDDINGFFNSAYAESYGGGIYGGSIIDGNHISHNWSRSHAEAWGPYVGADAKSYGGGIYCGDQISNSHITANDCSAEAFEYGGMSSSYAETKGGGIYGASQIANCLLLYNQCGSNGTIADAYGSAVYGGTIRNSTFFFNMIINGESEIYGCIIKNCITCGGIQGSSVSYSLVPSGISGTGNISGDPLFIDEWGDCLLQQWAAGQTEQSPCVDAGDPTTPLFLGTTRTDSIPDAGIIDMGYHYPTTPDVGIKPVLANRNFSISQLYPGEFSEYCMIQIVMPVKDRVAIRVYNLLGQRVAGYENTFDSGKHILTFYPGNERCYVLSARACGTQKSIKLIGKGGGGGPCRFIP